MDQLVRVIAARNPTLLFTTSAIAQELGFPEEQVREALFIQCTRGLLKASTSWRCIVCDSPALRTVYERDPITRCDDCHKDRDFVPILYFHPTEYLKARLAEANDSPKKDEAAQDEAVDRIASASFETPHDIDKVTPSKLDEMIAAVKDVGVAVRDVQVEASRGADEAGRGADAAEAGARVGATSAENMTAIRADPSQREAVDLAKIAIRVAKIGIVVGAVVALFVWVATDTHLMKRILSEPSPSPSASPTPKASAKPTASAKSHAPPKHHAPPPVRK